MLVVDTGVFVAAADLDDANHRSCAALIETHPGPLVTTALFVAESGWLIRRQLDIATEAAFYRAIADNDIGVIDLTTADWTRIADLIGTYTDIGLDAGIAKAPRRDHQQLLWRRLADVLVPHVWVLRDEVVHHRHAVRVVEHDQFYAA